MTGGLAAMVTGVSLAPTRAMAASATAPWVAGGNTGINTDGTNYLGTRNVAPLIFKTAAVSNTPLERMRITPAGLVGIGTNAPAALVDVSYPTGTALRATANGASTNVAIQGNVTSGRAVRAAASTGYGVFATASTGHGVRAQHTAATGAAPAVLAETSSTDANAAGVTGRVNPTSPGATSAGVKGINNGTGTGGSGVLGTHAGTGYGVRGESVTGYGVYGDGGYNGVYGTGDSYGLIGSSSAGFGVYGSGDTGVYASGGAFGVQSYGSSYGVYGSAGNYGCYGQGGAYGVLGDGTSAGVYGSTASGYGVQGYSSHPNTAGVFGSGGQYGVQGYYGRTAGVRGDSGYVGVWGEGADWGFFSIATRTTGQNYGIMAETRSSAGYAGWFKGRVHVEGTLTKGGGAFKIDHPQDPERKWLWHSFVESPDMKNIYDGVVTLDAEGEATVELPAYFTALNKDYRYQLTCLGGYAPVYVSQEVTSNAFKIAGGREGLKVSWQVTGTRQDDYANENRIPTETSKSKDERGTRQYVPKGSKATRMTLGPRKPDEQPGPSVPEPAPKPERVRPRVPQG